MSKVGPVMMDRRDVLLTTAAAATSLMIPSLAAQCAEADEIKRVGRGQSFDLAWRFHRGTGSCFQTREFDDSHWRKLDLPHDWGIEDLPSTAIDGKSPVGPFLSSSKGGTAVGFTVGGEGWYRKRFILRPPAHGRVEIVFEGVYMNSDVWVNGRHLGVHPNGYTPFAYDLTPHLAADGQNVIAVRVRNLGENSRWYSGSGIYRHVWLDVLPEQARIARWGVGVVTQRIKDAKADIEISTRLEDFGAGLTLISRVIDPSGRVVGERASPAAPEVKESISLESPSLWSPDQPSLYTLETELRRGFAILDRSSSRFGVRIVTFDAVQGMTINGTPTKLRGGCIHHDNGLLGAAAFDAAEHRKVRLLKARGYNAVRPSHNAFSSAFLSACDQQGMLVIAETFDTWREPKLPQDYSVDFAQHWRSDVASIVLSARNHPSIIMWSIGNEVPGRNTAIGVETQWRLANEVHRLDPSRPVTAAINGFAGRLVTPSAKAARAGQAGVPDQTSTVFLDVVGYNYKLADYEADHAHFPQRVLYGSESFPKDAAAIWALTERTPWLIGDFVWTAIDYLGEAGIGGTVVVPESAANNPLALMSAWPWVNAFCGDIDLIGDQKAQSLARDVIWGLNPLEIAVQRPVPEGKVEALRFWGWSDEHRSWTWPGAEGKPVKVRVYSRGDRVELRLNGRTLESKALVAVDLHRAEFSITYEPGVLEVIAYRDEVVLARKQLETVGAPAAIRLSAELPRGGASSDAIHYIALQIVDSNNRVVPNAEQAIELSIEGAAELIAFGSANPLAVGSFQSPKARTWNGRALAILRGRGRTGPVTLRAGGEGLQGGSTTLHLA